MGRFVQDTIPLSRCGLKACAAGLGDAGRQGGSVGRMSLRVKSFPQAGSRINIGTTGARTCGGSRAVSDLLACDGRYR